MMNPLDNIELSRRGSPKYSKCELENHASSVSSDANQKTAAVKLQILAVILVLYVIVEFSISGRFNSLSLLSDGVHNLSDVVSLLIALFMHRLETKRFNSKKYPYGYLRADIIGGLINSLSLATICAYIAFSAIPRFFFPKEADVSWMFIAVSGCGILVNALGVVLFIGTKSKESYVISEETTSCSDVESGDSTLDSASSSSELSEERVEEKSQSIYDQHLVYCCDQSHSHHTSEHHENQRSVKNGAVRSTELEIPLPTLTTERVGFLEVSHDHLSGHDCSRQPWYAHSHNHHAHLHRGGGNHETSMNLWSILVHSAIDAFSSGIICMSAITVKVFGDESNVDWTDYMDPFVSLLLSCFAIASVFPIIRESIQILMERTPINVNVDRLRNDIMSIEGVLRIDFLAVTQLNGMHFVGLSTIEVEMDSTGEVELEHHSHVHCHDH